MFRRFIRDPQGVYQRCNAGRIDVLYKFAALLFSGVALRTKFYYSFHSTPTCFDFSSVILTGCTKDFNSGRIDVLYKFAALLFSGVALRT
jgi:hypothetical protein